MLQRSSFYPVHPDARRMVEALPVPNSHGSALVQVRYLTRPEVSAVLAQPGDDILGIIGFGELIAEGFQGPGVSLALPALGGNGVAEVWTTSAAVTRQRGEGFWFSKTSDLIFGVLSRREGREETLDATTYRLYRELLTLTEGQGYPRLLRLWNAFPAINGESLGLERYKRFCAGRFQAFEERYNEGMCDALPAASAVGSEGGDLTVIFLASLAPGRPRENPRQVSAYHYPPEYGYRSPSFARATLREWGHETTLFISGTASVVGHESRHPGNPVLQLEETFRNMDALIRGVDGEQGRRFRGLSDLSLIKVYLRHPEHFDRIRSELDRFVRPDVPKVFLRADICRPELLIEIEGIAQSTGAREIQG